MQHTAPLLILVPVIVTAISGFVLALTERAR